MKKLCLILSNYLLCVVCSAQNLVPNPSFEEYYRCPNWGVSINYSSNYDSFATVKAWVSPLYIGSPDYFNICGISPKSQVPCNFIDCQPARTGNAYTGMYMFDQDTIQGIEYKENIEAKLLQPFIAGHQYYVSFYVSYAYVKNNLPLNSVGIDKIGAYFSNTQVSDSGGNWYLTMTPQIVSGVGIYFTDTTNWIKIEGTFMASGGEQWITLGRFKDTIPEVDTLIQYNGYHRYSCYMYLDDVCVRDITNNSHDTIVCVTNFPISIKGSDGLDGHYQWSTGETTERIIINSPGTYWRIATGECLYFTDTIRVAELPKIQLGNDTTICKDMMLHVGNLQQGVSYVWNTGDDICCIILTKTGRYSVQATDICGTATDSINVTVLNECHNCLSVPTAFTPNGDGKNDLFNVIVSCPIKSYRIRIYDRFGRMVFTSKNISESWDGRFKGVLQDANSFFYYVEYIADLPSSSKQMIKGDVILVR